MKQNKKGFTLIELLVVMAIIAVLVSLMITAINSARMQQRNTQRRNSVTAVRAALESFYASKKTYPEITSPTEAVELFEAGEVLASYIDEDALFDLVDPSDEDWRICYMSTTKGKYALWMYPEPHDDDTECPGAGDMWDGTSPLRPDDTSAWENFSLN
jgi:prepilin-type N-terminal cleavage/methylation domain-containing protein